MTDLEPKTDLTLQARVNLYYDLQPAPGSPGPLLIALHGYGANKRQMMREAQAMAPNGFAIASLQGFHQHIREPREAGGPLRFGFGWLTNFRSEESVAIHHQALLDLINTLIGEGVADPTRISVRYLEPIEDEVLESLPSATGVRGYVRELARMLPLDADAVASGYMRNLE